MKILDNVNDLFGDDLKATLTGGSKLKIAASYFSIYAYQSLKKELESIDSLEFIFTEPSFIAEEVTDKFTKEKREFYIPKLARERSLYGSEFEIHLRNQLNQKAIAKECANWIRKKVKFKSNASKATMQRFACVENQGIENQSPQDNGVDKQKNTVVYNPLLGFTAVDLGYQQGDAVSNYVTKIEEPQQSLTFLTLFHQIWLNEDKLEDVTDIVCDHIESVYKENSPEKIYFLILFNIFNEFLEDISEDFLPNDLTGYKDSIIWNKLFNFQRDAATGIINKLEQYNGCILADSVGLGKTFTALAVIKYYELRNKSVLVLCPKKLAENWLTYNRNLKNNILVADRFNYDVLCHTDLLRESGESLGMPLSRVNWGNYDLLIIDESHNFRNNDALKDKETRYSKLMQTVIREGVKTKVLMLSATPVNNRFNDLKNQLALAYEGEFENLANKLNSSKSIEEIFRHAQAVFNAWSKLPPEERTAKAILNNLSFDFFELLDSVTIARSRRHIQTFYDTSEIGDFPVRLKPLSYRCPLTSLSGVMNFNQIYRTLSTIKQAVYAPLTYLLPSRVSKYEDLYDTEVYGGLSTLKQADRERNLQALMTTNLLKRLESSVESFRITLSNLENNLKSVLLKINEYQEQEQDSEIEDDLLGIDTYEVDDDLRDFAEIGGKVKVKLSDMDLLSWRADIIRDQEIIAELLTSMRLIKASDDTKLIHLKELIRNKANSPINLNNKKVLVFTAYADTANYLYDNLVGLAKDLGVNIAKVTGIGVPKTSLGSGFDFQTILTLFSPEAKERSLVLPNENRNIDILVATDCISEGQNLQDCDYLVNYDIHWNPVRIIQRFGRIDRIGSRNKVIQLANYWPDISLDEYINLKERVENRMMIVDVTATGDDNVLTSQFNDISYRKEQLKRLQEEVIDLEDLKSGINITDLGLNDFRMDLVNHLKENKELQKLPSGLHGVVKARPDIDLRSGVIFALRNRNSELKINFQNRLHPYYLVYVSDIGEVIVNHTEVKKILDLLRSSCREQSEPNLELCRSFNTETQDGKRMTKYSELLSLAINSIIELKDEKDIDTLFTSRKTTALTGTIHGLDDFELLAFIVIRN